MKFTAGQQYYLERVIEMQGLDITAVKAHIKGDVYGYVEGDVWYSVKGDVLGDVRGKVWGTVNGKER